MPSYVFRKTAKRYFRITAANAKAARTILESTLIPGQYEEPSLRTASDIKAEKEYELVREMEESYSK